MADYEKVYVYFDTNSLECRHSGKGLFLSQFTVDKLYYDIEKLIHTMGLTEKAELCIPEIVWYELQEHLTRHYRSEMDSFKEKIESSRKSFGDLLDINYEFRTCNTVEEYKYYLKNISLEFLENPRVNAQIVTCPKDETSIKKIIEQAIHSTKPFTRAKSNGKEYSDAGFKDALILSTILEHTGDQLGIFISNDSDFSGLFNGTNEANLKQCSSLSEVQDVLSKEFGIISSDMAEAIIKNDKYLRQRILSECSIDENATVSNIEILSKATMKEDDIDIEFFAIVNGEKVKFYVTYNVGANELITASSEFCEGGTEE